MTYDEMIAVIEAAKEGKTIQTKLKRTTAEYADTKPTWNFDTFDYRVKPEPTIRPYANAEEFLKDMKEHGPCVKYETELALIYIMPTILTKGCVELNSEYFSYEEMTRYHTWQDGHPCGIEE